VDKFFTKPTIRNNGRRVLTSVRDKGGGEKETKGTTIVQTLLGVFKTEARGNTRRITKGGGEV